MGRIYSVWVSLLAMAGSVLLTSATVPSACIGTPGCTPDGPGYAASAKSRHLSGVAATAYAGAVDTANQHAATGLVWQPADHDWQGKHGAVPNDDSDEGHGQTLSTGGNHDPVGSL